MMIGRHRFHGDLILRFAAEAMSKGSALVMAFLLARWLAADGFGAYAQTQAMVAILVPVVLLGLGFALIRQIAGASGASEISAPVFTAFTITSGLTIPAAIVMWLLADGIAVHFSDHPSATMLVRMGAVLLPAAAWQSLLFEALRARHRVRSATTLQIGEAALSLLAMILLFLADRLDPVTALTAIAALKLLVVLLAATDFARSQDVWADGFRFLPASGLRAALALGIPFMFASLGEASMGLIDRVLVGSLAGADMAGRYVAAQTLVALLASWGAPYWWLLYPRMARAIARGSSRGAMAVTHRLFGNFIIWGTPLAVILALLGSQILTLAVGEAFQVSSTTIGLLVLAAFVNQAATPWEYFLYIMGKAMFLMWVSLAWGVVAIIGIVVLLPEFGLLGTAASVAGTRIGFALSLIYATGRQGLGPGLLPPQVTARVAAALATGIGVAIAIRLTASPTGAATWQLAASFLGAYLLMSLLASRFQARRRTT